MDLLRLKNMVDELDKVDDISYVFILDRQGNVLVHTFSGGFPVELLDVNAPRDGKPNIRLLDTGPEFIDDFAAPVVIAGTPFGTARIGLSRTTAEAAADRLALLIVFYSAVAMVVALAPSTLFARRVTERINRLKRHAEDVVKGNLDPRAGPAALRPCSSILDCDKTRCPAYGDTARRCWLTASPDLRGDGPESCRDCPVYREQKGDEIQDLAETFDVMAVSLKTHLDELRRTERVLTRQERLLRTILDATPDLVCLLDENSRYLAVNRAFAAFLGQPSEAIVGTTDREVYPEDEGPAMHEENSRVLSAGRPSDREVSLRRGGTPLWLHVVRAPVTDASGRIIGLLRTARDVTQLKQFQEQLIQAQKMESLGKLAGGVAHEINTPLGVILGYAQLLQEDVPQGSQILLPICKPSRNRPRSAVRSWPTCSAFPARPKAPKSRCASTTPSWRRHKPRAARLFPGQGGHRHRPRRTHAHHLRRPRKAQAGLDQPAQQRPGRPEPGRGGTHSRTFPALLSTAQQVTAWFADTGPGISPGKPAPDLRSVFHHQARRVREPALDFPCLVWHHQRPRRHHSTSKVRSRTRLFRGPGQPPRQRTDTAPSSVVELPLDHEETHQRAASSALYPTGGITHHGRHHRARRRHRRRRRHQTDPGTQGPCASTVFTEEEEALAHVVEKHPALAILDMKLKKLSGVEVLEEIPERVPRTPGSSCSPAIPTLETARQSARSGRLPILRQAHRQGRTRTQGRGDPGRGRPVNG